MHPIRPPGFILPIELLLLYSARIQCYAQDSALCVGMRLPNSLDIISEGMLITEVARVDVC